MTAEQRLIRAGLLLLLAEMRAHASLPPQVSDLLSHGNTFVFDGNIYHSVAPLFRGDVMTVLEKYPDARK